MGEKLRLAFATTTRADWGLLQPIASKLRDIDGVEVNILASNMHLLEQFGMTVNEIHADGFSTVDIPVSGTKSKILAETIEGFTSELKKLNPDAIIILGDRFEMLGVATAALLLSIPIVHIAGGTISEGAFDDSIRHAITKMSSLHLTETEEHRRRVIQMGEDPKRVISTGAIGVHNIVSLQPIPKQELEKSLEFHFTSNTILCTLHAATLDVLTPAEQMQNFVDALEHYGADSVLFTYPNNDVDPSLQIKIMEEYAIRNTGRVKIIPSLGKIRYLSALHYVAAVAGNSSGGIVEVPSMHIPTLDVGIRQRGRVAAESVFHCGSSTEEIEYGLRKIMSAEFRDLARTVINPYYRENTLELMSNAILSFPFKTFKTKKFYDLPGQC